MWVASSKLSVVLLLTVTNVSKQVDFYFQRNDSQDSH